MRATASVSPRIFQGHLQALKVIHRQQDNLRLSVAGQDDSLMSLAHSPGQLRKRALASDNGTGVASALSRGCMRDAV